MARLVKTFAECEGLQYPLLLVPAGWGDDGGGPRWVVTSVEKLSEVFDEVVAASYTGGVVVIPVGDRVPRDFWNRDQVFGSWHSP